MGEVIHFDGFRTKRQGLVETAVKADGGTPAELTNALAELERLTGPLLQSLDLTYSIDLPDGTTAKDVATLVVDEVQKRCQPVLDGLYCNLFLALIEIDWMRTKRSYFPADLRAQFEAIVASNLATGRPCREND